MFNIFISINSGNMMIDIDLLLALGAVYKKVNQGEMIFIEGTRCNFYYQLVSGRVRWLNINEEGKEYLQSMIEPGECFGELPLFDGAPYAATAIADEDCTIIKLHESTFHQLLLEHPDVHFSFSKLLAQRLRFKFFLLKEFLHNEPEERITSLISYLKATKHNFCEHCGKIKLTRQQIANMTCLRVETVIRTMRHMSDKGDISIRKGKVYWVNVTPVISRQCPV
jgi:CRP/FNR family transcriptional regulator, cyclic AMP receptor protein